MLLIIVRSVHMRKSFLLAFIMQIVDKSMTSISICFEHAQQANQLCIYVIFNADMTLENILTLILQ